MSNRIQLALKATIRFHVAAIVAFTWFSLAKFVATEIAEQTKLFPQQDEVERLVRDWAPLVWLAPNEKFMPGDVNEFLQHVHAEKAKKSKNARDQPLQSDDGDDEQLYYYETANELNVLLSQADQQHPWERRHKRMYKDNYLFNYIIDLPIGEHSSNWFLVTNDNIDDLLADPTSFIYGQSPGTGNIPIYAKVTICNSIEFDSELEDIQSNLVDSRIGRHQATYIPVSNPMLKSPLTRSQLPTAAPRPVPMLNRFLHERTAAPDDENTTVTTATTTTTTTSTTQTAMTKNLTSSRQKRDMHESTVATATAIEQDDAIRTTEASAPSTLQTAIDKSNDTFQFDDTHNYRNNKNKPYGSNNIFSDKNRNSINNESSGSNFGASAAASNSTHPTFHVTYWMFYPYSQGKSICTLSLGPFGNLPIPQLFGICLGTKKDFGSHVGDWEHMTLFFNGKPEPDQMYVSAHDAGAYYQYERLTGTFDFRRQETRKGILQHPNFPRTVVTSKNHPVLFSAQGSHGLWTAPGKHRFVRVARLFDVNGFGTAWPTWKHVEMSFDSERIGRSIGPEWLRFNGRWGNPKSKCHPLKKLGLNFCEFSDGPTGIPLKKPHFFCSK